MKIAGLRLEFDPIADATLLGDVEEASSSNGLLGIRLKSGPVKFYRVISLSSDAPSVIVVDLAATDDGPVIWNMTGDP